MKTISVQFTRSNIDLKIFHIFAWALYKPRGLYFVNLQLKDIRCCGLLQKRNYCSKMAEAMPCEEVQMKSTDDSQNNLAQKTDTTSTSDGPEPPHKKKPVCVLVLGMAGSGKTTFVQVTLSLCQF